MITMKALAAIALTGMGAGAMGANAYMLSHTGERAHVAAHVNAPPPAAARREAPPAPAADPVIVLEPVTLRVRPPAARAVSHKAPPRELAPCSSWRPLESGPAGHGVRALCVPGS
jgi:hypothetical protein